MTRASLSTLATPMLAAALFTWGCGESAPSVAADAGGASPDGGGPADAGTDAAIADAARADGTAGEGGGGDAAGCTGSGGQVGTATCCAGTSDFPNTCPTQVGGCGSCAPSASHEVKVCACARTDCFNGTSCVAR
jgi:hypothetical protein